MLQARTFAPWLALALLACRAAPPPVSATPSAELESMIEQQAETAAPGAEQVGGLFRGVGYDKGEFQDFRLAPPPGQCYTFIGAGDPSITALSLYLWDPSDSRITDDRSKTRQALVQHCATKTGTYRFQGKIGKGAGHFAVGVFGKAAPEQAAPVAQPEEPGKLDLEKMITDEAAAVAPDAKQIGNFYKANTQKSDFYVELEKGTCYWFIGAAQAEVDDYYIYLWDPSNKRIGETKADSNKAQFGHCSKESAMYHVQVKVDDADDVVKLGIFAKKQKGDDKPADDKAKKKGK